MTNTAIKTRSSAVTEDQGCIVSDDNLSAASQLRQKYIANANTACQHQQHILQKSHFIRLHSSSTVADGVACTVVCHDRLRCKLRSTISVIKNIYRGTLLTMLLWTTSIAYCSTSG